VATRRSVAGAVAIVLVTPVSIGSARWWRSQRIVAELELSPRQASEIDGIYRSMRAQSEGCASNAAAERRRLDDALVSDDADAVFEIASSRLATIEAECRGNRTLMLYRMFRQLSPKQRDALAKIAGQNGPRGDGRDP
jgi:uncharacterized membrane protein